MSGPNERRRTVPFDRMVKAATNLQPLSPFALGCSQGIDLVAYQLGGENPRTINELEFIAERLQLLLEEAQQQQTMLAPQQG